jgi:hypothetical protein
MRQRCQSERREESHLLADESRCWCDASFVGMARRRLLTGKGLGSHGSRPGRGASPHHRLPRGRHGGRFPIRSGRWAPGEREGHRDDLHRPSGWHPITPTPRAPGLVERGGRGAGSGNGQLVSRRGVGGVRPALPRHPVTLLAVSRSRSRSRLSTLDSSTLRNTSFLQMPSSHPGRRLSAVGQHSIGGRPWLLLARG